MSQLVLALTGASGALLTQRLAEKSPWPVTLVASQWGRDVFERECGPFEQLRQKVARLEKNRDLSASIASGSVPTQGMVIAPCSSHTLAQIATGMGQNLIARAAHCHLKEGRKLVLCLRETPLTLIDIDNARAVCAAGGIVMPLSPPFYMTAGRDPDSVSLTQLMDLFADRVLALFGATPEQNWETVK